MSNVVYTWKKSSDDKCPHCESPEDVYFRIIESDDGDELTVLYMCDYCDNTWGVGV